jgi:hypothetical protein
MSKLTFFVSLSVFEKEFQRCCKQFQQLEMYTAWIGNPYAVVPFEYLHNLTNISAVVGISFSQTHPDGIQFLLDLKTDLRIANEEVLYHLKFTYLLIKKRRQFLLAVQTLPTRVIMLIMKLMF